MRALSVVKWLWLTCLLALPLQATQAKDYEVLWQDYLIKAKTLKPAMQFPYQSCFKQAAKHYDVPLTLLLAIARGESDFDSHARSSANAVGIMQILWPDTARHLGIDNLKTLQKPCVNIDAGARYFRELLDRYHDDPHLALAAYNYGPGRIQQSGRNVPKGAVWYSGYIYDHLQYVLNADGGTLGKDYKKVLKWPLVVFDKPFRAQAFVAYLKSQDANLKLDWFDRGFGRFQVVALYRKANKAKLEARLEKLGFYPEPI